MWLRVCRDALIVSMLSASIALAQETVDLGVNLDDMGAFVNVVKHTNRYSEATGFDANGWPTSDFSLVLLDGRPVAEWQQAIDDPEQYRIDYSGRYLGYCTGLADVSASGTAVSVENVSYDAPSNRTSFDVVVGGAGLPNHGLVFLRFTNTRRTTTSPTGSGIVDLVVNRPGYPRFTNQLFTDAYLTLCRAANFTCYRYYNLQNIWDGEPTYPAITSWEQRKTPFDASQRSMLATNGKRDGWCWEYIVTLANTLKKDIWICIHMSCDDDYITQLAQYLKNSLDPSVRIYIENSNEVWSPTQATHGPYNLALAQARGITFDEQYAHRTVQLAQLFSQVFGVQAMHDKVRVILAGQHAYHGRSDNHLRYIERTFFGPPSDYIYATSTALYFGSKRGSDTDPLTINQGMTEDIDEQIMNAQASTYRRNHLAKAALWNLRGGCTSYEGGPHVPAGGGNANLAAQIWSHRTAAMADVIVHNYREGWQALGGGLAMYFALASGYNRYGCWGLTDDPTIPYRNYKMLGVQKLLGGPTNIASNENARHTFLASIDHTRSTLTLNLNTNMDALQTPYVVRVYDLLGAIVFESLIPDANHYTLPIPRLPFGLYVVQVGSWTRIASSR